MMRIVSLVLLGVVVFAVSLVMTLPAGHAWRWAGDSIPAQAYGLHGTVWDGGASGVIVEGHRLDRVRWTMEPRGLLSGELRYRLHAHLDDGEVRGIANADRRGGLRLEQLRFDADAADLVARFAAQPPPVGVMGRIDGIFSELAIDSHGTPTRIDGIINWSNGGITFGEDYPLGDYAVRLETGAEGIDGEVATLDATLRVDGSFRLHPGGRVAGEVIYQALDGLHPDVVQGLQFLGIPDPHAENRIRFDGNINNPAGFQGHLQ